MCLMSSPKSMYFSLICRVDEEIENVHARLENAVSHAQLSHTLEDYIDTAKFDVKAKEIASDFATRDSSISTIQVSAYFDL